MLSRTGRRRPLPVCKIDQVNVDASGWKQAAEAVAIREAIFKLVAYIFRRPRDHRRALRLRSNSAFALGAQPVSPPRARRSILGCRVEPTRP